MSDFGNTYGRCQIFMVLALEIVYASAAKSKQRKGSISGSKFSLLGQKLGNFHRRILRGNAAHFTSGTIPGCAQFPSLIAGGATATGTIAIQLAKASGLTVVTTCSPRHKDLLLSLGATAIFDYNSPNCAIEIRNYTDDSVQYALDCVTEAGTMKMCYDAIGSAGGRYVGLEPLATHIQYTRRTVRADWVIGRTLSGLPVRLDGAYGRPARPQDREFAEVFFALSEQLIAQGMLKPHPRELRTGGLEALVEGIDDLRKGKVRGKKLVYPLA